MMERYEQLLTFCLQMGTYTRMVVNFEIVNFKASTSTTARGGFRPGWNEPRCR